jgi:hypothetical protein
MDAMTCEMFEANVSEWLDEELAPEARSAMDAHRAACAACAALVSDLRRLQTDARQLPPLVPSRDLWEGIEARIEAPVIPLADAAPDVAAPRPARHARHARQAAMWQIAPRWLAAAAVALVVLSSGVTYLVARSAGEPEGELGPWVITGAPADPSAAAQNASAGSVGSREDLARRSATDREIEELRQVIVSRRSELDSATVATIERSLRVIDDAIAESRAALASDPANAFLNEQLDETLRRRLELMQALAFAPSRS